MQSHVLTDARLNTYDTVCFMAGALLLRPGEPCLGNELYCMLPSGLSDFPAWSTLTSDAERRICVGPIGDRVSKFCPLGGEAKLELAEERWVLLTTRAGTDTCEEKETDSRGRGVGGGSNVDRTRLEAMCTEGGQPPTLKIRIHSNHTFMEPLMTDHHDEI